MSSPRLYQREKFLLASFAKKKIEVFHESLVNERKTPILLKAAC